MMCLRPLRFGNACMQVSAAVLVELPGKAVSHEASTRTALAVIAPDAELTVLQLRQSD